MFQKRVRDEKRNCKRMVLLISFAACGQEPNENEATATPAGTLTPNPTEAPAAGDLTEEEIKFFNEEFFTTETGYPGRWVRNNILYAEFANPAQADIRAMLYDELLI